jgi:hypothetical protein
MPEHNLNSFTSAPSTEFALVSNNTQYTDEPASFNDVHTCHDSVQWNEAMDKEINQLKSTGTWVLDELPADCKPVKCKWTYKLKRDHTGTITRYKA